MYEIERRDGRVIIKKAQATVFNATESAYVIYQKDGHNTVSRVKDLPDSELLLALASAVRIAD